MKRKIRYRFSYRWAVAALAAAAVLLWGLSYLNLDPVRPAREAQKMEKRLHERQEILETYVNEALDTPAGEWLSFEDFPEDMVIYRYNADTLQSWVNRFPLGNDEIDPIPYWYRLNSLSNSNLFATPLAYLRPHEQYVNLGSGWYVVKEYRKGRTLVIAGLLIKTEYPSGNSQLETIVNRRLHLDDCFTTAPLAFGYGEVITGMDGEPLFCIYPEGDIAPGNRFSVPVRWAALAFFLAALMLLHFLKRRTGTLLLLTGGLVALRMIAGTLTSATVYEGKLFSPALYADNWYSSSFGELLMNNLMVFVIVLGLFWMKKSITKRYLSSGKIRRRMTTAALCSVALLLGLYIHLTIKSVILNSVIVLQLSRLTEISIYTFLFYISYAMLFCTLLMMLHTVTQIIGISRGRKLSLVSLKALLVYVSVISLYTLLLVGAYQFKKEADQAMVWTNKLSIERDLQLELYLCSVENSIYQDPYVRLFLNTGAGGPYIQRRLQENYFSGSFFQQYNLTVSTCNSGDRLIVEKGAQPVDCYGFFEDQVSKFGTPLTPNSSFFFMNNYNGRIGYLGIFTYYDRLIGSMSLFVEIDSKYVRDDEGYPAQLLEYRQNERLTLPKNYSYAKYIDGRLVSYEGDFGYPMTPIADFKKGFSVNTIGKHIHFANRISDGNIVIVSRPQHTFFPYIVSLSYLFLFYAALIMLSTRPYRKEHFVRYPKKSFRRKITFLIVASMTLALLLIAVGSVIFYINHIREDERRQMLGKMAVVQSTLTDHCKYTTRYNEINASELFEAVDRVAENTQSDINLYDPHGKLVRSTKSEIFDQYIGSSRINPEAYYQIIYGQSRQCIVPEEIAGIRYQSLYAPIFNVDGDIVTIANVPYFTRENGFGQHSSSIIAVLINIYIILILATIIVCIFVANSLARPMEDIGKKMKSLDVNRKTEHISYSGDDEIGKLVTAYNKMVDDLAISTQALAENEREQAWREMARQTAHDIKNPLTPMRLSIQHLLRMKQQGYEGWEEKFEQVSATLLEQIDTLADTASEFSYIARMNDDEATELRLWDIVTEQATLFEGQEGICISTCDESQSHGLVKASRTPVSRMVFNLVNNAVQALQNAGIADGTVKMTLCEDDSVCRLKVEDNGPGVSEDNLAKLFKPNFTTKSSGTGLGLVICRTIAEKAGGGIAYSKSDLGGACFTVTLPRSEDE